MVEFDHKERWAPKDWCFWAVLLEKFELQGEQICQSSVQFSLSVMSDSLWPHEPQHTRSAYHQLLEFTQIHIHWVSDAIQPSHPLSSPSPPAINLSQHQGLFKWVTSSRNESALRSRWPKYWSFGFSISPSNKYSGLISFRMDWLDLLAVQETLKCQTPTLEFKSINSSVLSFLYNPALTSVHDYCKNNSFD